MRPKKSSQIIQSALKLFSKKGFGSASMSDISKNMGMSVGNIYNYFPSKKKLAVSSIKYVTAKISDDLRYINRQPLSPKEKLSLYVQSYLTFTQKHPEMIEFFFRVYLSNRELFCDEEDCGFSLARDYIDEVERLVSFGIESGEYKERDFCVSFALIAGILGAMTFLNGEQALSQDLDAYHEEITEALYRGLSG
jgi:AcrR family transcriptional regulator